MTNRERAPSALARSAAADGRRFAADCAAQAVQGALAQGAA